MSSTVPKWKRWLAQNGHKAALGMLTGQDSRALGAIAACWELCAVSDEDGERAAIEAVRALLPGMQRKCRYLAGALIPYAADWGHKEKWWPQVTGPCEQWDPEVRCREHGCERWHCDVSHEVSP